MANDVSPGVQSDLAPTGELRVGLNRGNFLLVMPGSSSEDPRGAASDLARELGPRLGAPVEFSIDGSFDAFVRDKLEGLSGLRPRLLTDVQKLPGARLLDGQFTTVQQAIGTQKARAASATFLRAFVEGVRASGFVAEAISRNKVQAVSVTPPAP